MKKIIYLLVGIVLFGGLYYSCVPEELPGSIYGTVVDKATGEPIKSAGVELSPSGLKTVTGSEGQFEFTELTPGKYTLLITKTGYIDGVSHTIEVKPGQQAKGDVQIEKLPPALKVVNDNREEISILDFGSAEDDVARSFSVFNDGTETLEWELTATADWIKSVSKTSGTLSAGATQSLIITIDRAKLSSGENKTTVHITSNSGNKQLVVTATNNFQVTKLNVLPTTAITSTSATLNGEVVEDGSPIYTERGFVYAETTQPTISACIQKIAAPFSDSKTFAATVSDLVEGKKYYVRAYAIQSGKEMYSVNEVSFVTNTVVLPSVVTSAITNVGKNSATAGGNVTNDGGASVTERGVCYSTSANPTIANTKVASGSGTGAFSCNLTDLQDGMTYYARAYAINAKGTAYGEEVSFTTTQQFVPTVETSQPTEVSLTFAIVGGNVTSDGGASVTERGVCYATSANPTTANTKVTSGTGTGSFTCNLTDLQDGTTYYSRAYAINAKGTAYGEEVSFTTIKIGDPLTFTVNGVSFTMIAVGGGTFTMGATSEQRSDAYSDETPTHKVTLSDYMIGETEVTQELWKAVMGTNPSSFSGTQNPVERVSWEDCQNFIAELNAMTGKKFRLPTEAEWEFAARGGNKSNGFKYSGSGSIDKVAWHDGNSSSKTHPVKQKQANELGIYDMSGNVWEWCQDWYGSYSSSAQTNPTGPSSDSRRVTRGGSWYSYAVCCRVSHRGSSAPTSPHNHLGLRLAL